MRLRGNARGISRLLVEPRGLLRMVIREYQHGNGWTEWLDAQIEISIEVGNQTELN